MFKSGCSKKNDKTAQTPYLYTHTHYLLKNKIKKAIYTSFPFTVPFFLSPRPSRRLAFTLAEIIIVLGIVGIIAGMTIPSLIQKQQEQQTVAKLKKVYSTLSNAYTLAAQENGTPDYWNLAATPTGAANFITPLVPYLNIQKKCIGTDPSEYKGCMPADGYKRYNGDFWYNFDSSDMEQKVILTDGTLVSAEVHDPACKKVRGTIPQLQNMCGAYAVDINGFKGPNKAGIDVFIFWLGKDGFVPVGTKDSLQAKFTTCKPYGDGCTAWVIQNENMDYMHCDDLSWDGKKKCD